MDFEDSPEEAQIRARARAWLEAHRAQGEPVPRGEFGTFLDVDTTPEQIELAKRWQRLVYEGGWLGITWPKQYGGYGGTQLEQVIFNQELSRAGLPGPVNAIAIGMGGPTILAHGTEEQKQRYLRPMLTAEEIWCQLFSEPGAGSDLASLETRAVRDGDDYVVNGQKVWTSGAHYADLGILVARTDPNVPKHNGITYFIMDMHAPGVTVRPLRQISGGASFNEVFMDNVRIPATNVLGREGQGWIVAMTTLMHERTVAGGAGGGPSVDSVGFLDLLRTCRVRGRPAIEDSDIRQQYARVIAEGLAVRYSGYRNLTRISRGETPGPESATGKFMSTNLRRHRYELALMVEGIAGALTKGSEYTKVNGRWQHEYLELPGWTIGGGADEILKNIVGERVLGLPSEPRIDKGVPFKDLPRGTMPKD